MAKVDPYSCWDGVVNGATGDEEFENILSILDFPLESLEADGFLGDWDASKSHHLGPIPSDMLIGLPTIAQSKANTGPTAPLHRQVAPIDSTTDSKHLPFQSQSPVSVLENSSSSSAGNAPLIKSHISKRTRSKRARPSGANPWLLLSPPFPNSTNCCSTRKISERKKKSSQPERAKKIVDNPPDTAGKSFAKKCAHCEVTETPQWREGPMGPKTLCNACGVRYRSGRLYPEYRPAASPTFMPSLHSNSHKKVIEMRTKANQQRGARVQFVPVSSCFFDPIC